MNASTDAPPNSPASTDASSWWRRTASWFTAERTHYVSIAFAAAVYLAVAPTQGLFFDDWNFIEDSVRQVWEPHVGHLSVAPQLLFLALRNTLGIEHFLPWAVPVIVAHLVLAHLLWRMMRRANADAWLATALVAVFLFLGAGGENLLWSFQVGYIGALALAVGALMLIDTERLGWGRIVAASGLLLLAVASSGTALPVVFSIFIVGVIRHGFLRTAAVLAAPMLFYGTWYVTLGAGSAPESGRPQGIAGLIAEVPQFALVMLTEGLGSVVPVAVAGTLAASALWVWFCVTLPSARGVRLASYALAGAAPVFALLTGFSRAGFGVATAGSSRYVFLITAITLPVIALALTAIARRWKLGRATALVVIGVVLLYNLALVGMWVNTRAATAEATYDRIRAAAALAAEFPGRFDESLQIYPTWAPDLELADAIWFVNEGWISRGNPSPEARLSVLASLGTTASLVDTEAGTDCVTMSPTSPSVSTEGASVVVIPNSQANITIALRDGEHLGDARQFAVGGPTLIEQDFGATIDVVSTDGEVLVCAP